MDLSKTVLSLGSGIFLRRLLNAAENVDANDILGTIGLERRPSVLARWLPAIGLITVSAAVGAGTALLLAPSSGSTLRAKLTHGLDNAKLKLSQRVGSFESAPNGRHAVS